VTVRQLAPGLVDATVVIGFGGRPHALALRLDGAPGFWQLIELDYPTELADRDLGLRGLPRSTVPRRVRDAPTSDIREHAGHRQSLSDPCEPPRADPHPERDLGEGLGVELE
jgi:hypothetical protein